MCYLWVDAAKDRNNYKRYYKYYQEMDKQKKRGLLFSAFFVYFSKAFLCEFVVLVEPKTNNR